ncbi:hypothetical protein GUITHDRAFT_145375 [Guillardia theta CCMP2712]|uniref:PH domain-containing protein n=2 Tax=Guillardia theta TaxID=55529 RepID=L1IKU8_GUITC|nr:hypothetical protein GUITHDRAFT_145375 [Guillardia theta CCMP2712]EKX36873.1 hypothetical protein GUITHDRAFT_145375 [Guillardia theta CCMP2712]|eukprot:XP_005823853.1 hypothetical protein GUITHDRAFT_145375 [Guillardia theta CCMP2712]
MSIITTGGLVKSTNQFELAGSARTDCCENQACAEKFENSVVNSYSSETSVFFIRNGCCCGGVERGRPTVYSLRSETQNNLPEASEIVKESLLSKQSAGLSGLWLPRKVMVSDMKLFVCDNQSGALLESFWLADIVDMDARQIVERECHAPKMSPLRALQSIKDLLVGPMEHACDDIYDDSTQRSFAICVYSRRENQVRALAFKASSPLERVEWIECLTELVTAAKAKEQRALSKLECWNAKVKKVYDSFPFQLFVILLIFVNFAFNIAEAELNTAPDDPLNNLFQNADNFFTIIFTVELAINVTANWITPFLMDSWNVLDTSVVVVSLLSFYASNIPGVKGFRILRVLKVVRVFKRLTSLRMIITALASSVIPVANVFVILLLANMVYAILGVGLFSQSSPDFFGTFSRAFFTMFQCVTGDGWASSVARPMMDPLGGYSSSIAIFFLSYILIVSWIIVNVVLAVLLDEFLKAASDEKAAMHREKNSNSELRLLYTTLDPLLSHLSQFHSTDDLLRRLSDLFQVLVDNDDEVLTLSEFSAGLRKLAFRPIVQIDSHGLVEMMRVMNSHGSNLLDVERIAEEGMDRQQFMQFMRFHLRRYVQRVVSRTIALETHEDNGTSSILFILKYVVTALDELSYLVHTRGEPAATRTMSDKERGGAHGPHSQPSPEASALEATIRGEIDESGVELSEKTGARMSDQARGMLEEVDCEFVVEKLERGGVLEAADVEALRNDEEHFDDVMDRCGVTRRESKQLWKALRDHRRTNGVRKRLQEEEEEEGKRQIPVVAPEYSDRRFPQAKSEGKQHELPPSLLPGFNGLIRSDFSLGWKARAMELAQARRRLEARFSP